MVRNGRRSGVRNRCRDGGRQGIRSWVRRCLCCGDLLAPEPRHAFQHFPPFAPRPGAIELAVPIDGPRVPLLVPRQVDAGFGEAFAIFQVEAKIARKDHEPCVGVAEVVVRLDARHPDGSNVLDVEETGHKGGNVGHPVPLRFSGAALLAVRWGRWRDDRGCGARCGLGGDACLYVTV